MPRRGNWLTVSPPSESRELIKTTIQRVLNPTFLISPAKKTLLLMSSERLLHRSEMVTLPKVVLQENSLGSPLSQDL